MNWQQVYKNLQSNLPEEIINLWIKPLKCIRFEDDVVELSGPDRFFCSWIADNFLKDIQKAIQDTCHKEVKVTFSSSNGSVKVTKQQLLAGKNGQLLLPSVKRPPAFVRTLNPRYIFDEFIVGRSNEVAHAASQAIAQGDSSLGQCLYINSATGLGKSHLTHAVAHHLLEHSPGTRFNYLSTQQLTAEMVQSIQSKSMNSFKTKLQNCDVLLMEDVQALTGRAKTQEELSLLFDYLLETGKTVFFTGSQAPREIDGLDPGVRSRLSSGLIATISHPDLKTRILIIIKKAKNLNLELSEELAVYIAEHLTGDVRQIKSTVVGLKAKTKIRGTKPDLDMVKEVLADIIDMHHSLTPDAIRDFIAGQFKLTAVDLQSKSRKKTITFPRQISMYFSRKYTEKALSEIGKAFKRDHSTVVHSIRVISDAMNRNSSVRGQVDLLDKKINDRFFKI